MTRSSAFLVAAFSTLAFAQYQGEQLSSTPANLENFPTIYPDSTTAPSYPTEIPSEIPYPSGSDTAVPPVYGTEEPVPTEYPTEVPSGYPTELPIYTATATETVVVPSGYPTEAPVPTDTETATQPGYGTEVPVPATTLESIPSPYPSGNATEPSGSATEAPVPTESYVGAGSAVTVKLSLVLGALGLAFTML